MVRIRLKGIASTNVMGKVVSFIACIAIAKQQR